MFRSLIIVFFISSSFSQDSDNCITPTKVLGVCVNIKQCRPLIELLIREKPIPESSLQLLRESFCGFEGKNPKVCCPGQTNEVSTEKSSTTTEEIITDEPPTIPRPPDVTNHRNLRLLDFDNCGPVNQPKIFGGKKTGVLDFPWNALIAYKSRFGDPEFKCGGTVINKRYILTAAHCVTSDGVELLNIHGVRVGDHDITKEIDCDIDKNGKVLVCADKYQEFGIEKRIFHPRYSRAKLNEDIALLRVDGDINLQLPNVKAICLPIGSAVNIPPKKVVVTGWGRTAVQPRSNALMMIRIDLVANEDCAETYKRNTQIGYKQMCAGGQKGVDSCAGDSGGPLQSVSVINNTEARYVQYGVVSFGHINCGEEGFPAVYTRVPYYMDWILDNLEE